jgi:hypothetical protein
MSNMIYQPTDLAQKRVQFLEAARAGGARVRDKDGTSLVMLPERELDLFKGLADWSAAGLRLEDLLQRPGALTVAELGELAWLRVFDREDQRAFLDELQHALLSAHADHDLAALEECVRSWRITARQLEDPLRRSVLLGQHANEDLVDVARPDGS